MVAIPSNHRLAERQLIHLVGPMFTIDKEGRVWRIGFIHSGRIRPCRRRRAESPTGVGYLQIRAMVGDRRVNALAHRLVWQHIHGDIPPGLAINHKNGLKSDNRPENLELATYSENLKHAHQNGLIDQRGQKNPASKLSDRQVAEIRNLYAGGGVTQAQIAKRYEIVYQTVSKIVRGHSRGSQLGPVKDTDHRHCVSAQDSVTGRFIGPKLAGRLLDGRQWDEFPEVLNDR